ncbi:DUF1800 domain-containing protein [Mesobacterium sp. TK19101]|uniref:DUF1800 domain-containing protein n=1 Tax=Mesobacterium hydrothermale TaxID=3111907 RepID=A0ABU6HKK7_9RHOB|nr:DUF1800 domain-containing protein [Mesobacterium sp. TK19101]MEC3862416.1 DUF1800 domain-containing protein [Mesobacterium sp. TK19101]
MTFQPELAAIRFGCGLSPVIAPPSSPQVILRSLDLPDDIATRFPVEPFELYLKRLQYQNRLRELQRKAKSDADRKEAREALQKLRRTTRDESTLWFVSTLGRRAWTQVPFRERLTQFWADHFTATGKGGVMMTAMASYIESAIRPNVSGRFENLLAAAVSHPVMLHYLDQDNSAGPNSARAKKSNGKVGLNENLAREVIELHTLGVSANYSQTDVRELARLFAGMSFEPARGFVFRENLAEPGTKTVLGKTYGKGPAETGDISAVLRDLARHPSTARHLSTKLARHFISDTPDPGLVADMTDRYLETKGDLAAVYEVMLTHPTAWSEEAPNVKQPLDWMGSALRALAVPPAQLKAIKPGKVRQMFLQPLALMGHNWGRPDGPNGLPEDDSAWVSPQGLAARLQWAVSVPTLLMPDLPDPRDFVTTALGSRATDNTRFAAKAAETRWEGVGLVLASPAFQCL